MCGLTGFICKNEAGEGVSAIAAMTDAISHRGPDSSGFWHETDASVALGHRRLAILDVSPAGHQPMLSHCGRFIMAFNGEIYNHLTLRLWLQQKNEAPRWRGHSDTETLLACISVWGIKVTLERAVGMFAIALWDRKTHIMALARDRFGEKPLYYGYCGGTFLFGSELKALMAHPQWQGEVESSVFENYLRFGCVAGELSIFRDVKKLPPGTYLEISQQQVFKRDLPCPVSWWSAVAAVLEARQAALPTDELSHLNATEKVLRHAIGERMTSDVPLGAFLSGGIDSSLVVALMQTQSDRPVRTFSVGFNDTRYDESSHAEAVAAHLGTEHLTLKATSGMALKLVDKLPRIYDEPFADSSQLPTALISQLTREHVSVALSGDAGDELFGGYNRHLWVPRLWRKLRRLPLPMRHALSAGLRTIPSNGYDGLMAMVGHALPTQFNLRTFGEKLYKLAAVLASPSPQALYAGLASMNREPTALLASGGRGQEPDTLYPALTDFDTVEWMLLMDTLYFLVDDILVKVDRASMASSLEVRVPFLDPGVFKNAWGLPMQMKIRDGQGKWPLRQILYRHVPQELIERPKMGFSIPLDEWLRGPLREWSEDLLSAASLKELPVLNVRKVRAMWQEHLKCRGHHAQQLWTVLQLLAWQRTWRPRIA